METSGALVPCAACGRYVSRAAIQCPNCAHPMQQPAAPATGAGYMTALLIGLVLTVLAVVGVGLVVAFPPDPIPGVVRTDDDRPMLIGAGVVTLLIAWLPMLSIWLRNRGRRV